MVTAIDYESQQMILERLREPMTQYDLGYLTEEATDNGSRFTKDYFWCIDPLDGTLAFTEQRPGYSVSIALVARAGRPVIGVVHDPVTDEVFTAMAGEGHDFPAKKEDKGIKQLFCYFDESMKNHPKYADVLKGLEAIVVEVGLPGLELRYGNGSVLNACQVAQHEQAIYFKLPKPNTGGGSTWDFAATACLFAELGNDATDTYGEPLQFNDRETTFMNRRGVVYSSNPTLQQHVLALCSRLRGGH